MDYSTCDKEKEFGLCSSCNHICHCRRDIDVEPFITQHCNYNVKTNTYYQMKYIEPKCINSFEKNGYIFKCFENILYLTENKTVELIHYMNPSICETYQKKIVDENILNKNTAVEYETIKRVAVWFSPDILDRCLCCTCLCPYGKKKYHTYYRIPSHTYLFDESNKCFHNDKNYDSINIDVLSDTSQKACCCILF